jgi:hypothetical protein
VLIFTYVTSFCMIVSKPFVAWKGQRGFSSFYHLGLSLFFAKFLYHIIKYASIIHLKSSNRCRLTYFPTFTNSNTLLITTINLLQATSFWHLNMLGLLQVVDYTHEDIFTPALSQLDVLSLFLFLKFYSFVQFSSLWSVFFLIKLIRW